MELARSKGLLKLLEIKIPNWQLFIKITGATHVPTSKRRYLLGTRKSRSTPS